MVGSTLILCSLGGYGRLRAPLLGNVVTLNLKKLCATFSYQLGPRVHARTAALVVFPPLVHRFSFAVSPSRYALQLPPPVSTLLCPVQNTVTPSQTPQQKRRRRQVYVPRPVLGHVFTGLFLAQVCCPVLCSQ